LVEWLDKLMGGHCGWTRPCIKTGQVKNDIWTNWSGKSWSSPMCN